MMFDDLVASKAREPETKKYRKENDYKYATIYRVHFTNA